jgi:hypothetical protein
MGSADSDCIVVRLLVEATRAGSRDCGFPKGSAVVECAALSVNMAYHLICGQIYCAFEGHGEALSFGEV